MASRSRVFALRILGVLFVLYLFLQYLYSSQVKFTLHGYGFNCSNLVSQHCGNANGGPASLFKKKTVPKRSSMDYDHVPLITRLPHLRFISPSPLSSPTHGSISSSFSSPTLRPKNESVLPFCPSEPPGLIGYVKVILTNLPTLVELGRMHSEFLLGGHYKPPNCTSKDKVAIIVPFRDREEHLRTFLLNLLAMLKRQQIEFNIFVIEQSSPSKDDPFNRAMLFNVGFVEANKKGDWDCFIFHDVDLLPENDYNLYNCPLQPRHMSVAVDKMHYQLPYRNIFGGISALTKAQFLKVNGFSNSFWGWGAEDDDMAGRIAFNGMYVSRRPPSIARYKMLKHKQQKVNNQRYRVLQKGKNRFRTDGLSNLKYTVEQVVQEKTYTLIRVQLARPT